MHRMVSPEDLMLQLLSPPRQRTRGDRSGDQRNLLQLLVMYDANSDDGSSDGGGDSETAVVSEDFSTLS